MDQSDSGRDQVVGHSEHGSKALNGIHSGIKIKVMLRPTGSPWQAYSLASHEGIISMKLVSSYSNDRNYCYENKT